MQHQNTLTSVVNGSREEGDACRKKQPGRGPGRSLLVRRQRGYGQGMAQVVLGGRLPVGPRLVALPR